MSTGGAAMKAMMKTEVAVKYAFIFFLHHLSAFCFLISEKKGKTPEF